MEDGIDNSSGGQSANHDSLIAALAGDATKVGTAFIAADAAKSATKSVAGGKNGVYIIAGVVAIALIVGVVLLAKK